MDDFVDSDITSSVYSVLIMLAMKRHITTLVSHPSNKYPVFSPDWKEKIAEIEKSVIDFMENKSLILNIEEEYLLTSKGKVKAIERMKKSNAKIPNYLLDSSIFIG